MSTSADRRTNVENTDEPTGEEALAVEADDGEKPDLQARLEGTANGRALISLLVALTLAAIVVVNMPGSVTKDRLLTYAQPYVNALGLDQGWAVFAPNPRGQSAFLEARIVFRDGTTASRPLPIQHGLAEYWDYRWQRWQEQLLFGAEGKTQWAAYCRWVAARERDAGRDPVSVSLVSTAADTLPPGPGPDRKPWGQKMFYSLQVGS